MVTPWQYASSLMKSLPRQAPLLSRDERSAAVLWAGSGAMWLTGHPGQECGQRSLPLAACAVGAWQALDALSGGRLGGGEQAHQLLGERAAIAGLSRQGRVSAGGACHLLDCRDGVLAVNLARSDDWELLPAWLESDVHDLPALSGRVAELALDYLVERARLLGLAVAAVVPPTPRNHWFNCQRLHTPSTTPTRPPLVIDLSALWAGPLCGSLLAQTGARVIKVESSHRPDGARRGPKAFYDLLNSGKQSVCLDFRSEQGRSQLRRLLSAADIVIEAARPRALRQLGIDAEQLIAEQPGKVWLSITGYGRPEPQGHWIAYGDDAGVAAGLSWLCGGDSGDPVFCGDAIADPLTGLHSALLALAYWQAGGGVLLDVALSEVVGYCITAGNRQSSELLAALTVSPPSARTLSAGTPLAGTPLVSTPLARTTATTAADLGADTEQVLRELT